MNYPILGINFTLLGDWSMKSHEGQEGMNVVL